MVLRRGQGKNEEKVLITKNHGGWGWRTERKNALIVLIKLHWGGGGGVDPASLSQYQFIPTNWTPSRWRWQQSGRGLSQLGGRSSLWLPLEIMLIFWALYDRSLANTVMTSSGCGQLLDSERVTMAWPVMILKNMARRAVFPRCSRDGQFRVQKCCDTNNACSARSAPAQLRCP